MHFEKLQKDAENELNQLRIDISTFNFVDADATIWPQLMTQMEAAMQAVKDYKRLRAESKVMRLDIMNIAQFLFDVTFDVK